MKEDKKIKKKFLFNSTGNIALNLDLMVGQFHRNEGQYHRNLQCHTIVWKRHQHASIERFFL